MAISFEAFFPDPNVSRPWLIIQKTGQMMVSRRWQIIVAIKRQRFDKFGRAYEKMREESAGH